MTAADEPVYGTYVAWRCCSSGGKTWHHRIPRHQQHTGQWPKWPDPAVACWTSECVLAPAATHAQGIHHAHRFWPVSQWEAMEWRDPFMCWHCHFLHCTSVDAVQTNLFAYSKSDWLYLT